MLVIMCVDRQQCSLLMEWEEKIVNKMHAWIMRIFLRDSRMFSSLFKSNSHRHSSIGKNSFFLLLLVNEQKTYSLVIIIIGAVSKMPLHSQNICVCIPLINNVFQPINDFNGVGIHSHNLSQLIGKYSSLHAHTHGISLR